MEDKQDHKLIEDLTTTMESYGMPKFKDRFPAMDILQRIKDFGYRPTLELMECTVAGHNPPCIKCPHCHEWFCPAGERMRGNIFGGKGCVCGADEFNDGVEACKRAVNGDQK